MSWIRAGSGIAAAHRCAPGTRLGASPDLKTGGSPLAPCIARWEDRVMSGPLILIVDDHPGFRKVARLMLEAAGCDVTEVANGADAVAAAGSARYDLVLLDIHLPDVDGFEVARRLARTPQCPLVVLTSSCAASEYGPRVEASPAAGFVVKDELSGPGLRSMIAGAT